MARLLVRMLWLVLGLITVSLSSHTATRLLTHPSTYFSSHLSHCFVASYMIPCRVLMIQIRILFRLVEFSGGVDSSITKHVSKTETYQYIFDSTLMLLAMIVIHFPHPGTILIGEDAEPPYGKVKRAMKRAAKVEKKHVKAVRKERKRMDKLSRDAKRAGVGNGNTDEDDDDEDIEMGPYVKLTDYGQGDDKVVDSKYWHTRV